jgi:hypothetical protein
MKPFSLRKCLSTPWLLYPLLLVFLLPLFSSFYAFISKKHKLAELEERALFLNAKNQKNELMQKREKQIVLQMKKADPHYIEKALQSLSFLEPEKQKWKIFLSQIEPSISMRERSRLLEGTGNKLEFVQQDLRREKNFTEIELSQTHPVELNEKDLKKVLSLLEGENIEQAPQILIKSFDLRKKTIPETQESDYVLSLELITRQGSTP